MTDPAAVREAEVRALPRWWWAAGLTLQERLAAPAPPALARATALSGRPAPWSIGDEAGFAARRAFLELDDDRLEALAAESAEQLGARTGEPDWARYVERAVAEAPEEPRATGGSVTEAEGAAVFLPALRPLIGPAWAEVAAGTTLRAAELHAVRTAFEEQLGERLTRQAARTLVKELSIAREAGRLAGGTPHERFASFTGLLGTRQGLAALFTRYPVLARMLGQSCVFAARATAELVNRFAADREAIVAGLLRGTDPGALVRLDLGRGDVHQENRSVALLHFDGGAAVVYKPRPLDQHALLDRAVGWLNGKVPGLGLRTPRVVRGAGYGWLEFIEYRGCESVTDVDRFYRRQGALLALLYAVDGADMHYENVIACADQPVLVDAETLLHSGLPPAVTAGPDPAAEVLQNSVHRTCLLPQLLIGENGALDISALGGATGEAFPSDGIRWEGAGTDTMRVVRGPVASPAAQNRPLLRGRTTGHADHRAALLEGFRAGYEAIGRNRGELLTGDGCLTRWATTPGRLIARSTRLYTTLLEESTHPDALGDALARDSVFAVLWTESVHDPARQRLIEHEIADLWSGDVPLFFHYPFETAVRTSRDVRIEELLPAPSLRIVEDKILAMSEVDRFDQEWVISATLAVTGANSGSIQPRSQLTAQPAPAAVPEPSRLLSAACGIADEIAARAVHGSGRVNWLGLEEVDGTHWSVLPMGGGLAQGYCGVALFLAQIGAVAGADRYTALARRAVEPLPALLSALVEEPELSAAVGPGALHGLGGIVYALARLAPLLQDGTGEWLPDALTALELAAGTGQDGTGGPADEPADNLADGLAGALAATLAVQRMPGTGHASVQAGRLAGQLAGRLLARAGNRVTRQGFAHGDAGIAWALLRYAAAQPASHPDAVAAAARPYAAALLRSSLTDAVRRPGDLTWHSGLSGAALAAADAPGPAGEPAPEAQLARSARLLSAAPQPEDMSLRHGGLGILEALGVLAARGHDDAASALSRRTGQLLGRLQQHGHRCGTPDHVPSPGLLTGLSGIGYGLLRLGFPDAVPSVLLLGQQDGPPDGPRTTV
ncbi:type 2 lanthipeptide synthetase LanM family protein [Streptomyces sodiiphilus]|uniref:type 2 lanthipeptide synthetase LanM family protein n=1 Tax=Streptomyces sodiiphilus TaxID=226217 RepID=UPI0031DAB47C